MLTGRPFHALGGATENIRPDETSLKSGTTRSCLPAERREALLYLGKLVKYDGVRPLTAWCNKRQFYNPIFHKIILDFIDRLCFSQQTISGSGLLFPYNIAHTLCLTGLFWQSVMFGNSTELHDSMFRKT